MSVKASSSAAPPAMRVHLSPGVENRRLLEMFQRSPQEHLRAGKVFKPGSRGFAVMTEIGGRPCFLKHYRCQGLAYRLRHLFRPSRAVRTFRVNRQLRELGIPVPAPLFCLEERTLGFLGDAYLVTEFIAGSMNLREFWDGSAAGRQADALQMCAEVLGRMHAAGYCHGDLKWNNLLVRTAGDSLEIILVDLDAAARPKRLGRRLQQNDLQRFLRDLAQVDSEGRHERRFLAEWKRWSGKPS